MIKLLLDGDYICWRFALMVEEPVELPGGVLTYQASRPKAEMYVNRFIKTLQTKFKTEDVVVAFSVGRGQGYRQKLFPTYKAQRTDKKPLAYYAIRELLEARFEVLIEPQLEADDLLAILASQDSDEDRIIVSADKDFKSTPCRFFDVNKAELHLVDPLEATFNHMYQTLIGDRADGYPGCPGIGPVRAKRLLAKAHPQDYWDIVVQAYEDKGLTKDDALVQARLAYLLQHQNYDFETKEITHWLPTT